jgi:3',5'-cyclic AMP phosphodiesterase CpdA
LTVRIAQISDTHLSADRPIFVANFDRMAEHLRADRPDIVIDTGDISLDGADSDADLAFAVGRHRALGLDMHLIAGNHDIGDDPGGKTRQPVNEARVARWRAIAGEAHFVQDIPGWRLVGIDSLLLGLDLPEAHEQDEAVRTAVARANGRAIALFLHKPICDEAFEETIESTRFLRPTRRAHLLSLFGARRHALAACGHVHQYRDGMIGGMRHVWAPAVSFLISDPWQPVYGAKTVGYVEHLFHPDGTHAHRLVGVRGLAHIDLATVPEAYGDVRNWGPGGA